MIIGIDESEARIIVAAVMQRLMDTEQPLQGGARQVAKELLAKLLTHADVREAIEMDLKHMRQGDANNEHTQ